MKIQKKDVDHIPMINALILDDCEVDQMILQRHLSKLDDYQVNIFTAFNSEEARNIYEAQSIDIIFSDYSLAQETSADFISFVNSTFRSTGIILCSGHASKDVRDEGFSAGAGAFLSKNEISPTYIAAAIEAAQKSAIVENQFYKLEQEQEKLRQLVWVDDLTGALNRRRFKDLFDDEMKRAKRLEQDVSLVVIDIDHFKNINDIYGHTVGDQVLVEMVRRWRPELRSFDHLGRMGGEEFAILLTDCDVAGAVLLSRRLIEKTAAEPILVNGEEVAVTISAGVSPCLSNKTTFEAAYDNADKAMYQAKNAGRNRVSFRAT